jgi:hypothetical protein
MVSTILIIYHGISKGGHATFPGQRPPEQGRDDDLLMILELRMQVRTRDTDPA